MRLSVIIPCYNEGENIPIISEQILPILEEMEPDFEVIAIDDGSQDQTGTALKRLSKNHNEVRILQHSQNRGLGASLRSGISAATGEWTVTLDADLTFHPRQIRDLLDHQKETGADCVGGSPFLKGGSAREVPMVRSIPSRFLNGLYRALLDFHLTAYTTIFRLYRTGLLKSLPLKSEGFEINAEIYARLLQKGARIEEVPAVLTLRQHGESKLRRFRELKRHILLIRNLWKEI